MAAMPPYKQELTTLVRYQQSQLEKLNVNVHLNTEMTAERILELHADHVILATGATPALPPIKGIDNKNVVTSTDILSGRKIRKRKCRGHRRRGSRSRNSSVHCVYEQKSICI